MPWTSLRLLRISMDDLNYDKLLHQSKIFKQEFEDGQTITISEILSKVSGMSVALQTFHDRPRKCLTKFKKVTTPLYGTSIYTAILQHEFIDETFTTMTYVSYRTEPKPKYRGTYRIEA